MKIAICCSASFFKDVNEVAKKLTKMGLGVAVPYSVHQMAKSGDYGVSKVKTWLKNEKDFSKKTILMNKHIKEIEKADAILVINNRKNNVDGYIGGNTLIEMAIAFYLKKPIYVLNYVMDRKFLLYEEIMALKLIFIDGDLRKITQ